MNTTIIKTLTFFSGLQGLGYKLIRIAIFVIFVWIGGLKFANYEANGIVHFVANSPIMSFFMPNASEPTVLEDGKTVKSYTLNKIPEGQYDTEKSQWHRQNGTYSFAHGLGILICLIGTLVLLGLFNPYLGLAGDLLCIIMTIGTLSFLITTPETWVTASEAALQAGEWADGFPFLSGAGRLVLKDCAILAGAILLLSNSAKRILSKLQA